MSEMIYWDAAQAVCTDKEIEALRLRDQTGWGVRRVAASLGISRTSCRDRLEAADRKIVAYMTSPTQQLTLDTLSRMDAA